MPVGCGDSPKLPEQSSEVLTFRTLGGRLGLDGVPTYLVETFLSRNATRERTKRERRARSAAEELTGAGIRVRFERSIHVPEDEICFFLVDAASGREAALVAEQAALEPIRVVEAVSSRKEWQ